MKKVSAKVISWGGSARKKPKKNVQAQVRVLFGDEGSQQRRSVTRHVMLDTGIWIGRNPDEQAEFLHATASTILFAAQELVTETTGILENLQKITSHLQELSESADALKAIMINAAIKEAARMIAEEEANLRLFEENQRCAEKHQEDVERDYPLYVRFNF